jgi:hypothetical protein
MALQVFFILKADPLWVLPVTGALKVEQSGGFMKKRVFLPAISMALPLICMPLAAGASVIGSLGNFDVVNDTGFTAHGFEIELEGIHIEDVSDVFGGPGRGFPTGRGFGAGSVERYGSPFLSEYSDGLTFGTRVTYMGLFDASTMTWDYGTPSGVQVTPGDNCWSGGGLGYSAATPCDHFGVGTTKTPTKTNYSWLLETTPNSEQLTKGGVTLPTPAWQVIAPAAVPPGQQPGPPRVIARVDAPDPILYEFGDAVWVKVFTTELDHELRLEDLVGGNAAVDGAETEIEWQLLQQEINKPAVYIEAAQDVGAGKESVLRRYEFYKFSGKFDPETNEALFDVGFGDSRPGPNDVGTYLGAQNGGVNVAALLAPVPEPETWAMMLAGLGMVFGIARRRRQSR